MNNPEELALVVKALKIGIGGCVEWDITVIARLKEKLARHKLTMAAVRLATIQHVRNGGEVIQKKEIRDDWKDKRDYWYYTIVPMPLFRKGLFVEFELSKSDPEYPEIRLVQAHEEL